MPQHRRKLLLLASEVRSGSTYLAETIAYALHERCGLALWDLAQEHLSRLGEDAQPDEALQVAQSLYLDASGFAATKLMCKAVSVINKLAAQSEPVRETFFGDHAFWIVLRRRDRLKQAVSLAMAEKSGVYHHYGDAEDAADRDIQLEPAEIEAALRAVCLSDVFLEGFAAALPAPRVVSLYYEDFLRQEAAWLNRINAMCGFPALDVASHAGRAKLQPTAQREKQAALEAFRSWFLQNYI